MASYTVLARKYRSQNFDDLIGQEVLVKTLKNAIDTNRISHAYILTGIRGTGKTSTARIMAKALNCLGENADLTAPTTKPCGVCENCVAIAKGTHIDVLEIDAASHTGVDNMRDIMDNASYRPTNGRYKVYIIDEVHMLTTQAFNALLKTLEEPPEHVIFILATTDIRKVPITILSRCQRFDLVRVDVETLKKHFFKIAKLENVELDEMACDLIARYADGSVRDGLSLLDQAISQTNGKVTEEAISNMLQRADRHILVPLVQKILEGDIDSVLNIVNNSYLHGSDLNLLLTDLMDVIYWLTRIVVVPSSISSANYTNENKDLLKDIASKTSIATLSRVWQMMLQGVSEMQLSTNSKQTLDMLLIRIVYMTDVPPVKDILEELKKQPVKNLDKNETKKIEEKKSEPEIKTEELKQPEKKLPEIHNIHDLTSLLQDQKELTLLNDLKNDIEIVSIVSGNIELFNRLQKSDFVMRLKKVLDKATQIDWKILSKTESKGQTTIAEKEKAIADEDPLLQNALGLFSGASINNIKSGE